MLGMDSRPIGVFDSGVGGLTVLHECLVTMPNEDFVYLGDHARLPYGPRPLAEIRRFAREIGVYLEQQDVKLILVACNAATSAALPRLQEELTVPVVGVITPEAHAAVQATRNRRVGLLATAATVEAGRYADLVHALDAGISFHPVACPQLVPLIEGGRKPDQLRRISFEPDYLENPHGSVVITQGRTKVLCTAMVEEEVPRWLRKQGRGWITAEYSLLPASTGERVQREAARGKQQGRTVEIQRLIGRAVRAVADFEALGERTLWLDCDVLQADGGTRCAAICGASVAAMRALDRFGLSRAFRDSVAAVSVGVVDGVPLLDLDYAEDSSADTDMNVVLTGDGRLVEVQATAERDPFARETLDELLELATAGIGEIAALQAEAVALELP